MVRILRFTDRVKVGHSEWAPSCHGKQCRNARIALFEVKQDGIRGIAIEQIDKSCPRINSTDTYGPHGFWNFPDVHLIGAND